MGITREENVQTATNLLEDLLSHLPDHYPQVFNGHQKQPEALAQTRELITGLYKCTLEDARTVDPILNNGEVEQMFFQGVDSLGFRGFSPKRIQKWVYNEDGLATPDYKDWRENIYDIGHILKSPVGDCERLLSYMNDKATGYLYKNYASHKGIRSIENDPLINAYLFFEKQMQQICPLQLRDRRIQDELVTRQAKFERKYKIDRHDPFGSYYLA